MRRLMILVSCMILSFTARGQVENGVFKCTNDTYSLLRKISESACGKGEILLSITTHQDLGWVDEVEKCIIMRDTLWMTPYLKRLKEDPGFRMDVEQTSVIMEYISRHPDKKAEIQKGLDDGRILVGATYTQPYEEMFSGESLVRQLYLGKKWLSDNFNGYESDTYYNSDVPGRTLQMSQILSKSVVKNMFVSRHEKGVFDWYSPDSSRVTMFSSGHYIDFYNILGKATAEGIAGMAEEVLFWGDYYDADSKEVIIPALLNYEFIWDQKPVKNCDPFISTWNSIKYIENESGERIKISLPPFKYGNLNTCLNAIRKNSSKIRKISGERPAVWMYIHGPSHHYAISASRKADIMLADAEKFSAFDASVENNFRNYDESRFRHAWQAKIYPDHGWGGKGGEITDRLFLSKFISSLDDASALLESSLQRIASKIEFKGKGVPVVIFNGLNWKRNDPVTFSISFRKGEAAGLDLYDKGKKHVDYQLADQQYYDDGSLKAANVTFIAAVPSLGYNTYYAGPVKKTSGQGKSEFEKNYENSFFSMTFGNGGIEKLIDKSTGKDVKGDSGFNLGEVFTMQSVGNGAGEFSDIQQPTMEGFDKTGSHGTQWEKVADGPVFTSFRYRQPLKYAVIEETIIVYNQKKRIDFEIDIKNWEGILYREFRAAFPLNMASPQVAYEVPMGVVRVGMDELKGAAGNIYNTDCRLVHPRTLTDWVNISDSTTGATISSSVIAFDYLDPTVTGSQKILIQPVLMASRKSCHPEGNDYLQYGDHHFSFSLFLHEPGWKNGFHEGKQAQNKLYSVLDPVRSKVTPLKENQSFLVTGDNNVLVTAVKKCENDDNLVMRIVDMDGSSRKINIGMLVPVKGIVKTNLIEKYQENITGSGNSFSLDMGANSIQTYKLKLSDN